MKRVGRDIEKVIFSENEFLVEMCSAMSGEHYRLHVDLFCQLIVSNQCFTMSSERKKSHHGNHTFLLFVLLITERSFKTCIIE